VLAVPDLVLAVNCRRRNRGPQRAIPHHRCPPAFLMPWPETLVRPSSVHTSGSLMYGARWDPSGEPARRAAAPGPAGQSFAARLRLEITKGSASSRQTHLSSQRYQTIWRELIRIVLDSAWLLAIRRVERPPTDPSPHFPGLGSPSTQRHVYGSPSRISDTAARGAVLDRRSLA
jgi:hypothetical protein